MKTDFKKSIEAYRARQGRFDITRVPPLNYLMIDGRGDPNTSIAFEDTVTSLFPLAYAIKFASKQALDRDFVVMPLEGLWWAPDIEVFTRDRDKSSWQWTLMIMMPNWVSPAMHQAAVEKVTAKGSAPLAEAVRLAQLDEGLCVQTLHLGPFEHEASVLSRMHHAFIPAHGLQMTGKHHEIYLSDFRTSSPDRLRTILRQPVTEA